MFDKQQSPIKERNKSRAPKDTDNSQRVKTKRIFSILNDNVSFSYLFLYIQLYLVHIKNSR